MWDEWGVSCDKVTEMGDGANSILPSIIIIESFRIEWSTGIVDKFSHMDDNQYFQFPRDSSGPFIP